MHDFLAMFIGFPYTYQSSAHATVKKRSTIAKKTKVLYGYKRLT